MVTRLHVRYAFAADKDDSRAFVAHDHCPTPLHGVIVRMADAAGVDLNQHFAARGVAEGDLVEKECAASVCEDSGGNSAHRSLSSQDD
jgi:hypothetical protein